MFMTCVNRLLRSKSLQYTMIRKESHWTVQRFNDSLTDNKLNRILGMQRAKESDKDDATLETQTPSV